MSQQMFIEMYKTTTLIGLVSGVLKDLSIILSDYAKAIRHHTLIEASCNPICLIQFTLYMQATSNTIHGKVI